MGEVVSVGLGNLPKRIFNCSGVRRRRFGREYIELSAGDVVERRYIGLEILRENFLRNVCSPVGELCEDTMRTRGTVVWESKAKTY